MKTSRRWICFVRCTALVGAVASLSLTATAGPGGNGKTRPFALGFTPFPWDLTPEAVRATDDFVTKNGDIIAHHFDGGVPWTEALADKPFHTEIQNDWKHRKGLGNGKKVLLSLTPLDSGRKGLALYRGKQENMPLPDPFPGKALNDPLIAKAYLAYCRRAIDYFKPDWCAIGIEVNELIINTPEAWPQFLDLYRETYAGLKREFPLLPLCATVTLHALTDPAKQTKNGQRDRIRDFLKLNDFAGISYYPFMAGNLTTVGEPLAWIRRFTDKPVGIAETGFPAETIKLKSFNLTLPSNAAQQKKFFDVLLERARRDDYIFVVAFLHRDYDALWERIKGPEFLMVWKDCGLLDEAGNERPACDVWRRFLAMPYAPAPKNGDKK
jgi:hypothetical protein